MKISDAKLTRVPFIKTFGTLYELNKDTYIILNSIHIYTIKDDWIHSEVDFKIFTAPDNKRYISPLYSPFHCDKFVLCGERLVMCKTIEIKAQDYIDVINLNGDFTFTFTAENSKFNLE